MNVEKCALLALNLFSDSTHASVENVSDLSVEKDPCSLIDLFEEKINVYYSSTTEIAMGKSTHAI